MKTWNFKVKSNPQEIIKKLDSAFGSVDTLVYKIEHNKNDSVAFKVRKRVQDANAIIHDNQTIVNGKMLKTDVKNETDVEISFTQHFLRILFVSIYLVFGLLLIILAIILAISSSVAIFIVGGVLLAVGIAIWIDVQKRFEKDIQKYKTLISKILEL